MIWKILPLTLLVAVGSPLSAAEEPPDPCSLLTAAQLETTFGKLKGTAKPDVGLQKERECHYQNEEGNSLVLRIYSADRWGLEKGINSENNPVPLPNLGEEAFLVKKGTDKEIYIRKKAWILEIDGSADSEKLKALAAVAAGRLP
ncbi:MAG: hypothetical protein QOG27_1066 [Verrucomicrobiota bacterium]